METVASEKKKLLVIDDDMDLVQVIRMFLQDQGYIVFEAYSGMWGLDMAREKLPDLVILDIEMPLMKGPEVLQTLRDDPRTASIPVLFLTGAINLDAMEATIDDVAQDYVLKPVKVFELLEKIEGLLGRRPSGDE